jgi:hypothetical protein
MGVGIALLLQALAAFVTPLAGVLRVTPLQTADWAMVLALASLPALIGQLMKMTRRPRDLS